MSSDAARSPLRPLPTLAPPIAALRRSPQCSSTMQFTTPSSPRRPNPQTRQRRLPITELLAFDVGIDIVGIIDLRTDAYACYRGARMPDGARRILGCDGVVSFNGIRYDLPALAKIVGVADADALSLKGTHCDVRIHACSDRWPPRDGEDGSILGPGLRDHYRHYFGWPPPDPPRRLDDDYERSNWRDCHMAAELWRRIIGRQATP